MHIKKLRKYFTKRICGGGGSRDETDDKRRTYEESTNTHNRARFHTNLMNKWKEFLIKNYGREHTEHGGAQTHTHAHIQPNDRPSEDAAKRQKTDDKRKERSLCFCWRELLSFSIQLIEFSSTLIINDFIKISILFILYIAGFLFLSFFHVYLLFAFVLLHWRRRESQTSKQYSFFLPAQIQTFLFLEFSKCIFRILTSVFFRPTHNFHIISTGRFTNTDTHIHSLISSSSQYLSVGRERVLSFSNDWNDTRDQKIKKLACCCSIHPNRTHTQKIIPDLRDFFSVRFLESTFFLVGDARSNFD